MKVKKLILDTYPDVGFIVEVYLGDEIPLLQFKLITFLRGVYIQGMLLKNSKYKYYNPSAEEAVFMLLNEMMGGVEVFMRDNQIEIDSYVNGWFDRQATAEIQQQLQGI